MSKMTSNVEFKKKSPQHGVKNGIYHVLNLSQDIVFDIRLWKFVMLKFRCHFWHHVAKILLFDTGISLTWLYFWKFRPAQRKQKNWKKKIWITLNILLYLLKSRYWKRKKRKKKRTDTADVVNARAFPKEVF